MIAVVPSGGKKKKGKIVQPNGVPFLKTQYIMSLQKRILCLIIG